MRSRQKSLKQRDIPTGLVFELGQQNHSPLKVILGNWKVIRPPPI